MMKEDLIKQLVEELGNEGYNVDGLLTEDGVLSKDCGLIKWWEFDDVDDEDLKDNLIDILAENE